MSHFYTPKLLTTSSLTLKQLSLVVANRSKIIVDSSEYDSLEELDAKIMDYIGKDDDGKWKFIVCNMKSKYKKDVKEHVEIQKCLNLSLYTNNKHRGV